jgi:hypothetical protein
MGESKWSNELFDGLRGRGDALADNIVAELFEQQDLRGVQRLLGQLVGNSDPVPEQLPLAVRTYFESAPAVTPDERREVESGERFFALHGPEIMLSLCCAALPFDYANARAVQVLHRTGFLAKRPNLRVAQTAQMIVDVLTPGGLGPDGRGLRSAQKVRLMHAAVRRLLLSDTQHPWDIPSQGFSINQEDLLYTLVSFTQSVLDGLAQLRLDIPPAEAQAYLDAWRVVARAMGLEQDSLPTTLAELLELRGVLEARNQAASLAGKQMTEALAGLVGDVLGPLGCFRFSLLRFFAGSRRAELLGIPSLPLRDLLVSLVAGFARMFDDLVRLVPEGRLVFRWLSLRLIQHFINTSIAGNTRAFRIPTELQAGWKTRKCAAQVGGSK